MSTPLPPDGLFRTRLAGRFSRTTEAFHTLRGNNAMGCGLGTGLYGGRIPVSADPREGEWELTSIRDEIFVNQPSCQYAHQRTECVLPEDFIEFHFMVTGSTSVELSENGQIAIGSPNLTVVRQGADAHYTVACGPGPWRSVGIHIPQASFRRFVTAAAGADSAILRLLDAVEHQQIAFHQMPLGVDALNAVEQLLSNPYEGYRRLLYTEAKVYEVLCASLDLWQTYLDSHATAECFSTRDLKLIERAKDLLLLNPSQVPTIPQLARAVGTNTSKLKRGFKFLYGVTVFEMGHRFRMNHALRLLSEDRLAVSEVAAAVGYQHQTSFTAAFRDFFGMAPKDARRMAQSGDARARLGAGLLPATVAGSLE